MKKEDKGINKKIKRFSTFFKRATKPKQPPKEKIRKPKSYLYRKTGAVTFWLLFSFMFLFVFVNVFLPSPSSGAKEESTQELNHTTQPESIQFAIDFSREYFTWNKDEMEKRQERLQNYLAINMDKNAGLAITNMDWSSTFQNATLNKVEEVSKNKAHIVLRVKSKLTKEVEVEVEVEESKEGEKKKETKTEEKQLDKYFVVPVGYDGENLGVYSAPYFTNVDNEGKSKVSNVNLTRGLKKPDSSAEINNIKNFLGTFFTSYAEDPPDKLSYILNDTTVVGLNGTMDFVKVKKSEVYQGNKEDQFIVYAEVRFSEPNSELKFDSIHYLLVSKDNNRYIVDQMHAENYIEEITANATLSTEEIDEAEEPEDLAGELESEENNESEEREEEKE